MNMIRDITKYILPYMKSKGFLLSRKNFQYITNDIAYCISFDAPGGLIYVTAYVMPLYIPCENRYYTYGNRLNNIPGVSFPLLQKNADINKVKEWCEDLCQCIEKFVIPFFTAINMPSELVNHVASEANTRLINMVCPDVFVERLHAYTYLYLGDVIKTKVAIKKYHTQLINSTFLTNDVRSKYFTEIATIDSLLNSNNEQMILDYITGIIADTKVVLQ